MRGEEKTNEKKRKGENNKGNERKKRENERKRQHVREKNIFGGYCQPSSGLRHHPQALNKMIKQQF